MASKGFRVVPIARQDVRAEVCKSPRSARGKNVLFSLHGCPSRHRLSFTRVFSVSESDQASTGIPVNPLELLRVCSTPPQRAALLQQLDGKWREAYSTYRASPAEECIAESLGVSAYNVMMLAVQNPLLVKLDADTQLKPAIVTLKQFNIDVTDIWHLVEKKLHVFLDPIKLQRWLDFLSVYGLRHFELHRFLMRVPETMYGEVTVHEAGQAIRFLKTLGMTDEYLSSRILPIWPMVCGLPVEEQLRPCCLCLMQLGLTVQEVLELILTWPEILTVNVEGELQRYVGYLKSVGCSAVQCGAVIRSAPHLVQFSPEQVFEPRIGLLHKFGISKSGLTSMLQQDVGFLTVPGGFDEQLRILQGAIDLELEELGTVVSACPQLLCQQPGELLRNWKFVVCELHGSKQDVVRQPHLLSKNMMHEFGPRYAFVKEKGLLDLIVSNGLLDVSVLLRQDVDFCAAVGVSIAEFMMYKTSWEKQFVRQLHLESEQAFQDALANL